MPGLRLIVGLGNPGAEYLRTRHNAGFWFIDALAQSLGLSFGFEQKLHAHTLRASVDGQQVLLLKPSTFMNKSGIAVASALRYYKIDAADMLIAHDELDLPPGTARLKFDGGHGGQNGLRDTIAHLGDGKFHRLRIGIGHPGHKDQVTNWVLGRASISDENAIIASIAAAFDVLPLALAGDYSEAMKRLHTVPGSVAAKRPAEKS